jgi:hypothetical protein
MKIRNILAKEIKLFLASFKVLHKKFAYILAIDAISIGTILLLGTFLNFMLVGQLLDATGGAGGEDFATILMSMTNDELTTIADSLQTFLFTLIGGFILFGIVSIGISAYSRSVVWETILRPNTKNIRNSNVKNVVNWAGYLGILALLSTIFLYAGYIVMLLLVMLIFFWDTTQISIVAQQILSIGLITLTFNIIFLACRTFSGKKKVWGSVVATLKIVWSNTLQIVLRSLIQSILFIVVVFLLGLLTARVFNAYSYIQYIQWISYLLYLSWIRWYYIQTIGITK